MTKFSAGQTVRCIKPVNPRENPESNGGGGWRKGREFKIGSINNIENGRVPIVWPVNGGSGVFEDYVELVEYEWDEKENVK